MSTNFNSLENISPFHYQAEKVDSAEVPLLPRSAWTSRKDYLRVLFRVKKRLDRIEDASSHLTK
jgi:hypothetical protein